MALLITGTEPTVVKKNFTTRVHDVSMVLLDDDLIEQTLSQCRYVNDVPNQASVTVYRDIEKDLTLYTWTWWEIELV